MRHRFYLVLGVLALLSGCDNFVPNPKTASYDPVSDTAVLPHPCPDWSQAQTTNYLNQPHSNFGCAVNTNAAVQLENSRDLMVGRGSASDVETGADVIRQYRAGDLPKPLTPMQTTGTGQ